MLLRRLLAKFIGFRQESYVGFKEAGHLISNEKNVPFIAPTKIASELHKAANIDFVTGANTFASYKQDIYQDVSYLDNNPDKNIYGLKDLHGLHHIFEFIIRS